MVQIDHRNTLMPSGSARRFAVDRLVRPVIKAMAHRHSAMPLASGGLRRANVKPFCQHMSTCVRLRSKTGRCTTIFQA
jgi:hypothetical protein